MNKQQYFITITIFVLLVLFSSGLLSATEDNNSTNTIHKTTIVDDEEEGSWEDSEDESDDFLNDETGAFPPENSIDEFNLNLQEAKSNSLTFAGYFKEEIAYAYAKDEPYFNKLRSVLNLSLNDKFSESTYLNITGNTFYDHAYRIEGRGKFTDETLETYESESELRDFYISSMLSDWFQIKFGRQIIAWGQSDAFQVIDLVNPRDQRELAQTDLEDSRLPVVATKFSVFKSEWTFDLVWVYEIRTDKTGQKGSDFDPYINLRAAGLTVKQDEAPQSKIENSEIFIRLFKAGAGYDFSLIAADMYDDDVYFSAIIKHKNGTPYAELTPEHQRVKVVGVSANIISGTWIWKTEVSYTYDKALTRNDLSEQILYHIADSNYEIKTKNNKDVLNLMLGIEYSGIEDLLFVFETLGTRINHHDETTRNEETEFAQSLRLDYEMLNNQLKWQGFVYNLGNQNGMIARMDINYDISDGWNLVVGIIDYIANDEDNTLYPYRKQDRIYSSVKYSF